MKLHSMIVAYFFLVSSLAYGFIGGMNNPLEELCNCTVEGKAYYWQIVSSTAQQRQEALDQLLIAAAQSNKVKLIRILLACGANADCLQDKVPLIVRLCSWVGCSEAIKELAVCSKNPEDIKRAFYCCSNKMQPFLCCVYNIHYQKSHGVLDYFPEDWFNYVPLFLDEVELLMKRVIKNEAISLDLKELLIKTAVSYRNAHAQDFYSNLTRSERNTIRGSIGKVIHENPSRNKALLNFIAQEEFSRCYQDCAQKKIFTDCRIVFK